MSYYLLNNCFLFDNQSGKLTNITGRKTLQLKSNEWKLLNLFSLMRGEDLSVEHILTSVWEGKRAKSSVATSVKNLRAHLGDSADTPRYIQTQVMKGYAFIANVEVLSEEQYADVIRQHSALKKKSLSWFAKNWQSFSMYSLNVVCIAAILYSCLSLYQQGVFAPLVSNNSQRQFHPMILKGQQNPDSSGYDVCNSLLLVAQTSSQLDSLPTASDPMPEKYPSLRWSDSNRKVLLCHLSLID